MLAYELSNSVNTCTFSLPIIKVWDINYKKIGNQIKMEFQNNCSEYFFNLFKYL